MAVLASAEEGDPMAARWRPLIRLLTLVALISLWTVFASVVLAQEEQREIESLGPDQAGRVERYRVTIQPGGSLWNVATERLPLIALDQGDRAAIAVVEQSFQTTFPGRPSTQVQPGESFVLEVPAGTFVSKSADGARNEERYIAFNGDVLVVYPRDPHVLYRLVRKDKPRQAEVRLTGVETDAVKLAARVFDVDPPDFLQVRWMREAMENSATRVTVDLERPYLDQFRNVRSRALRTEDGEEGRKVYVFSEAQAEVPFVRVEDAVGDVVNPGEFPREFRVEYFKDGTIRRYVVTQPGDLLAVLKKPEGSRWAKAYGDRYSGWVEGEPGELNPFASALNSAGGVQPGRILVLTYYPKVEKAGSGIECFGIPLVLMAFGMLLGAGGAGGQGAGTRSWLKGLRSHLTR